MACYSQNLSPHWEELTGPDFVKALQASKFTCVLPFGIVEKHGPSGPLGTDLIDVRYATFNAVKEEYAVVFPEYYVGQIFEAMHQPGTLAYSDHLQFEMMQETIGEMARNGCKKILIVNGHGGNNALLQYFVHGQLVHAQGYVVYGFQPNGAGNEPVPAAAQPSKPGVDGHAGEGEISNVMASRPELVHTERAGTESGKDRARLDLPTGMSTGITWYSKYPDHYQGDAASASAERGKAAMEVLSKKIANAIRAAKADEASLRLQNEFQERMKHPVDTPQ
jgi:creatinine amidohydrolase